VLPFQAREGGAAHLEPVCPGLLGEERRRRPVARSAHVAVGMRGELKQAFSGKALHRGADLPSAQSAEAQPPMRDADKGCIPHTARIEPQRPAPTTGTISGVVVSGAARTPISGAFVWLYRQNPDGTWPATSPGWGSPTYSLSSAADGAWASGPIPFGNYRVRFFTVHTGSQWWQYVTTFDAATTLTLSSDNPTITGIDGWFYKP